MDGEPEGGLEDLLLLHAHAEGEQQARDVTRQLARQLDTAAVDEQVDDGQIEVVTARRGHGLGASAGQVDAMPLAPENDSQGTATGDISVDEENTGHLLRGTASHVPRVTVDTHELICRARGRLPAA
jgi:hypothetical protein